MAKSPAHKLGQLIGDELENGREVQGYCPDKKDCIDFLRLLHRA